MSAGLGSTAVQAGLDDASSRRSARSTHDVARRLAVALGPAVLLIAYALFGLATLDEFPLVWEDEPWYTQSAWSFTEHGSFALPMFAGLVGFERENVVYGRTYLAAVAAVYEAAGVSPYTARIVSFIAGLVAVAATYGLGRELWDRRAGTLAGILFAVAPTVVLQSHDARPEMLMVAAWTTAFYLLLSGDRTSSRVRVLLGGLLAALAADMHLNGLIVAPALFLAALVKGVSRRTLVLFSAGAIVGAAWWLVAHLLMDPELFIEQLRLYSRGWPILDLLESPVTVFGVELARYLLVEPLGTSILAALAVIAAIVLVGRRDRDRAVLALLTVMGVVFMFMALFTGARTTIYALLLWPAFALLVARHIEIAPRPLAGATAGLAIGVSACAFGITAVTQWPADYDRYVANVRRMVPEDATVLAHPTAWFGLMDRSFYATHYLMWDGPFETVAPRLGIDHVVTDRLEAPRGCPPCNDPLPDDARAYVAENWELVGEVIDPFYGRARLDDGSGWVTRVYRLGRAPDQDRAADLPAPP